MYLLIRNSNCIDIKTGIESNLIGSRGGKAIAELHLNFEIKQREKSAGIEILSYFSVWFIFFLKTRYLFNDWKLNYTCLKLHYEKILCL